MTAPPEGDPYVASTVTPATARDAPGRDLAAARVLIVGVGGLGSWAAELLAHAGVGLLRLADPDRVDLTNLHRQAVYDEQDALERRWKVDAAAERLRRLGGTTQVQPVRQRVGRLTIARLAEDVDVIVDGTDNFASRFLINDYAVKAGRPWVFAGAVGAEAQTMTIVPGLTMCLRCVLEEPPPVCMDPSCREAGVLGPVVATIAAIQAAEAIKVLSGRTSAVRRNLLKLDLWGNQVQTIGRPDAGPRAGCPCCGLHEYEYLEP